MNSVIPKHNDSEALDSYTDKYQEYSKGEESSMQTKKRKPLILSAGAVSGQKTP